LTGQGKETKEALAKIVEADPENAVVWNDRGDFYLERREYAKALADYSRAIELKPDFAEAWWDRGFAYTELHQHDKAIADCTKAIELAPKDVRAWSNRGFVYNKFHEYDKAIADCTKAIELNPKYADPWINRGWAYRDLQEYDKALDDLNKAIELDSGWRAKAWNIRSMAYLRLRQYDPTDPIIQSNLALLLANRPEANVRDPKRAVQLAEKAVKGAPKEPHVWTTLGIARYRAGDWKGATQALEEAIKLLRATRGFNRCVGRSLFFLAMARQQLGQGQEARQAYDRALTWLEANRKTVQETPWLADELHRWQTEAEQLLKQRPEKKQEPPAEAPRR
jgi:tetratricopeptide (TPR) repeat protein